ncbi:MAG: autotransporter outer membrane beta-barrel domain-containing protein [Pseudomonadota bacterium]
MRIYISRMRNKRTGDLCTLMETTALQNSCEPFANGSSNRASRLLNISFASAGLVGACFAAATSAAASSCETSSSDSTEYVCSGSVLEEDIDATDLDDDITDIVFSDIDDSYDEGSYFFAVENVGDEGNSHGDDGDDINGLTVTFTGSDTTIELDSDGDNPAVSLTSEGGSGHSGKDRTTDTSSGKGGNGGDGGDVEGEQELVLDGGTISGEASGAASVTASGGKGGSGGKGRSYFTSDGEGGEGGDGGDGADAKFELTGGATLDIETVSDEENGIYVLSSGGAGNDGGKGEGGVNAKGGDGGTGGDAGDAKVVIDSGTALTISTSGNVSHGIEALSEGGDGGDGGKGTESTGDSSGGDGGGGGAGGDVEIDVQDATITTTGTDSIGILARSYGGAGGDGGDADSTFGSGSGGSSENPGPSGDVTVSFSGDITTKGDGDSSDDDGDDDTTTSSAILAQSVGGFAGDAGDSDGFLDAWGASSESAGDAGDVTVEIGTGTTIKTTGTYSDGIEAQSIGGGGGKGGSADAIYSVGGDGSAGGNGGAIIVSVDSDNDTTIETTGDYSAAISAQSVGGGGGKSGGASELISVGGTGGTGGDGGDAAVFLAADLKTKGDYSEGVLVQSLGGGGGVGRSTDGVLDQIGGSGGDGGNAGLAEVQYILGDITTSGIDSDAVDLQSIGGGGGKGASSTDIGVEVSIVVGSTGGDGGDGGSVSYFDTYETSYTITTDGEYSAGISAQSGGGGGGNSGSVTNVTASIGVGVTVGSTEDASSGGKGGSVSVDTHADISTGAEHSDGIFAQSYGGGGGNAGQIVSVDAGYDLTSVSVATGGAGGTGGDGGSVKVTSAGSISATSDHSYGIFAQSTGGSGGKSSNTYAINSSAITTVAVATGATGGDGGDGSTVKVTSSGAVTTKGDNAAAIYAQSVGGGGGSSGTSFSFDAISATSVSVSVGGDGGAGGSSGSVHVTNSGTVKAYGDNSDGIFAQSLAGGGGNSGGTYSGDGISGADVAISVGGSAGDGDTSAEVKVDNTGNITVSGANANAIYAESRGGSGGKSGTTMAFDTISFGTVDLGIGGEGGDGGTAGNVYIENYGHLHVSGDNGVGIYANSQGGEGGNSGTVVSGSLVTASAVSVGIGNGGGEGGIADDTSVYNYGSITTSKDLGYGILAQSIGGAGGNGSTVISADVLSGVLSDVTDGISGDVEVAVGGEGGDGGAAGEVYVESSGNISTDGDKAYGILAQSIGGNGGSGGSVFSFDLDFLTTSSLTFEVSIGGSGAGGAASDTVQVINDDLIVTRGIYAHGILAQSIGGSGGTGGSVTAIGLATSETFDLGVSVAVGGEGGDGSEGAEVDVTNAGKIAVRGNGSAGVYAQSVGGDGGDGGSATTYVLDYTASTSNSAGISLSVAVGGEGGTGNSGNTVSVSNTGSIYTEGSSGDGIFAQSVGGGGGDGGSAEATSLAFVSSADDYTNTSVEIGFELGGSGGAGGDGGEVDVTNDGTISTNEDVAVGIFAQSVGGGGGTGGESGSTSTSSSDGSSSWVDIAEEVASDVWDTGISTYTTYALYQNYSSYFTNWTVSVGGDGGAAGDGSEVNVTNTSTIRTSGVDSTGIYAQSVGGGGGTGGTGTGASIKTKVEIGGTAGAGGHGDSVSVTNSGNITTQGERANGVWAQSVGGGGGDAGDVEGAFGAGVDDLFGTNFSIDIGANYDGDAGNGGDGGDVSVQSTDADITTSGQNAVGVWAQSVGGGGGTAGSIALSYYIAGSNGAEGDSGDVTVALDGAKIVSTGDYSVGVFAQSSSGSYESSDTSDLDDYFTYDGDASYESGDVSIELTDGSSIDVSGTYSRAILAASTGYDSAGSVTIDVGADSSISGSDGNAHVISIYDGNSNEITNYGTIEDGDFTDTSRDDTVYVVYTDVSSDDYDSSGAKGQGQIAITNYGTISGSIKLYKSGTANSFSNEVDGVFNMGSVIDLGDGDGVLSNAGTLSPGGTDQIFTSTISDGALEQGEYGSLLVDLEMNSSSSDEDFDLIVAEDVTTLYGSVEVNATGDSELSDGDSGSVYILVADDVDDEDLSVSDTALVDYEVALITGEDITIDGTTYSDTSAVELSYTIDLSSSDADTNANGLVKYSASKRHSGTTEREREVHKAIKSVFNDLLNAKTGEELDAIAAEHTLAETGTAQYAARSASSTVHNKLRSCPTISSIDPDEFLKEQDCLWFDAGGSFYQYENQEGSEKTDERAFGLTVGGQRLIGDGFVLGGMLQHQQVYLSGTSFNHHGDRVVAGAVAKHENGPITFSVSAAYGWQNLDLKRNYSVSGSTYTATSNVTDHLYSADARVTYLQQFDESYLRWGLGLGLYHTRQNPFDESGNGPLNWSIESSEDTDVVFRPQLEVGRTFGNLNEQGRIYAAVGLAANLTDPGGEVTGSLIDLPGDDQMSHVFKHDRYAADVRVGLDLQSDEDFRLSVEAGGVFSENSHGGDVSFKARWLF